jgi:transporter family-2 protein
VDKGTAVVLTALAGGLIALQAPVNSHLGKSIGTFQGALVSFVIGTVALLVVASMARGGLGQIGEARGLAWHWFTGGLLGAIYVTTVLVTVRTLGAGGVTAATISAQLTMSVVVDRMGWLGVEKAPITAGKLLGIALLGAGVFLVVRD